MKHRFFSLLVMATSVCQAASPSSEPNSSPVKAVSCDCSSYPFTPNPPCYGKCVGNLVRTKNQDLSLVKDLDPGVAVSIKVLSASKNSATFDFSKVQGKTDLEYAAEKAMQGKSIKFEPAVKTMEFKQ